MARKSKAAKSGNARRPAPAAAPEVIEEVEGDKAGFETGIVLTTSLFLIAAIVLVALASGRYSA
jgi:hypothetical protein